MRVAGHVFRSILRKIGSGRKYAAVDRAAR